MIVASNNITLSVVNDGTIVHLAYANSADGKDGFYVGGGVNLLQGTGTLSGDVANGGGTTFTKGAFNGYDAVKTNYAWRGQYINLQSALGRTNAKAGDWYTISVYVKADQQIDTGSLDVYRVFGSGGPYNNSDASANDGHLDGIYMQDKPITTQWQQYSWSFQISDISLQHQDTRVEYSQDTGDNWIYWAGWVLEKGTVAHAWSPAPSEAHPTYMGTYADYNQSASSNPSSYQWSLIKGADGTPGKDGLGIRSTIITYQLSSSGTTTPTETWSTTVPTLVKGQYLWTRTTLVYTDNTTKDVYTVSYVAKDGNDGTNGVAGKDGVGIKSTTITYQESTSGTTTPTENWTTNPPTVDDGNYLWTRTVWTYTDGTSETGYSVAKAGEKGSDGTDGKSVWYYPYDRGANRLGSRWSDLNPAPTKDNQPKVGDTIIDLVGNMYQITNVVVDASISGGGTFDYGPTLTSIKGAPGIQGDPGKNGQTTYFHIAYANSADGSVGFTYKPGDNSYDYFGTYTDYTLLGSDDPTKYKWVKMFDSSKKRNFTTTPTTPYDVGDTWTESGVTYFCTKDKATGAFDASNWKMQQLTIQSLDSNLQANINGTKNLLMVDDITYYSSPALDSTNTYNEGYQFDYTSTDTTYVFQVQAKSTVNGDYVNMYPAWGSAYSQSEDKTSKVTVTTSPSVSNQTSTFNSSDSNVKLALTTDWVTYTCTISGTWDKGSVLTALLGRVYNSETKGTVAFRNVKLVAGNAITDYTSDDSITVAQGSNYWDSTTLQHNSSGTNLIVQSTLASGYVSGSDGSIVGSDQDFNTDYIPASGLSTVTISSPDYTFTYDSNSRLVMYDADKKFLGAQDLYPTTTLSQTNVAFIRISINFVDHGGTLGHLSDWLSTHRYKLEKGSVATPWSPNPSESGYDSWPPTGYYTPWYPISEGQRVFLTHYDYPAYPGIPNSASIEFADSNHNFISNGTNNSHGSSNLDGSNSSFISPQSLGGVYYNERMLKISIASEAYTSGTYQDLYIKTSGLLQSKLAVSGRGTTVATFDPYSGQRVDTQYWDTFATVDNANALVNYLNSIANQDLVVAIATQDSFIQDSNDFQIASQNLCNVLQSMGLPSSYAPADLRGRVSFAFVGHTTAYQGTTDKALISSSKGDNQVSTLTAYVSNGHISSANTTGLISENAHAKMTGVGTNLLKGTSSDFQTAPDSSDNIDGGGIYVFSPDELKSLVGNQVTIRAFIHNPTTHTVNLVIWTDANGYGANSLNVGTGVPAGTNGYSTITAYSVPYNATQGNICIRAFTDNAAISGVQYKEFMLEKGTVSHDWSPNPSDSGYASWLQNQYQGPLVAYANAPAKTAYFRAGYSFSTDEINRVHFMVTVDKLSTNYSSSIADVSSNAVRKDVSYRGVTLNDNGLTATAGNTQVIVNSSNGFEIKKSGVDVFSVDTNGNLTITGSTISTGNISGVDFSGQHLTLSGTLSVNGSIVAANGSFAIDQNGMVVSPQGGGSVVISDGGLTIQGSSVGSQSTAGTYGSNDSLAGDAGLFATKDKAGNTKTWITSSGTLIAQDAVIHGNVSVDNLTLTSSNSKIMFGSGFTIDGSGNNGSGKMTVTSPSQISNGTYSDGVIEGSELDIGTDYHSKLSDADKYRYHVSNIGETTFGMSQDLGLSGFTMGINSSYLSLDNAWTQGQVNFNGQGSAPNNAMRSLGVTSDIYQDSYGWKHRFSAPVNGTSDIYNAIPIWDKSLSGTMASYNIGYSMLDSITNQLNKSIPSLEWGGSDTLAWTLSTIEFPRLGASLFTFSDPLDLYPDQNQTISLTAGETYVFGAYIWHCGLNRGAKVSIELSTSDSVAQNSSWVSGNVVEYRQSGYSICTYTPSSNVCLRRVYVEAGATGPTQGCDYGVPLSITDPFAVSLNKFTSKLFGGGFDTLTSLGGRFGMPYPHLDASQHGVLGIMRADNLTAGDKVVVSIPINYESNQMDHFPQINLGLATIGNDDNYIGIQDLEFQPLMPGYYTYDFYFVWQDEYKKYITNNMVQLNLISKGIGSVEKAYVVSVDSARMGIFAGSPTTSSSSVVNEYQTKFSPLGSLQLSHINNSGDSGFNFTIAGQTQLTSEGLTINSSFSFGDSEHGGMHISINGKSGISIGGNMNYGNAATQPALSFYGSVPYNTLLENTIEPQYKVAWDEAHSASGIWFDNYGNAHGYGSSLYWHVQSPSKKSNFAVPLADGNEFGFALSDSNGNSGGNILRIGLVHFTNVNSGYIGGNYPALLSGSGDSLSGIAFCGGYVIIFGNQNKTNNLWSFPQGTSDGHTSNSGTIVEVTGQNNM